MKAGWLASQPSFLPKLELLTETEAAVSNARGFLLVTTTSNERPSNNKKMASSELDGIGITDSIDIPVPPRVVWDVLLNVGQ